MALPVYCASEPALPLLLSKPRICLNCSHPMLNACIYVYGWIAASILNREVDINFGSVYENVIAQELRTHGFDLYYYNSKKMGELDFLVRDIKKSSAVRSPNQEKGYTRHAALSNVLTENYMIFRRDWYCAMKM